MRGRQPIPPKRFDNLSSLPVPLYNKNRHERDYNTQDNDVDIVRICDCIGSSGPDQRRMAAHRNSVPVHDDRYVVQGHAQADRRGRRSLGHIKGMRCEADERTYYFLSHILRFFDITLYTSPENDRFVVFIMWL